MKKRFLPAASCAAALSAVLLAGCNGEDLPQPASAPLQITGVVLATPDQVAAAQSAGLLSRVGAFLLGDVYAHIVGLTPSPATPVQLVRLNSAGAVSEVIATVTTDGQGRFSFDDIPALDSSLAVRVDIDGAPMHSFVTGPVVDITPASELVVRRVRTALSGGGALANFTVSEVAALTGFVRGLDVDVTGLSFEDAVDEIDGIAGSVLGELLAAYATPGTVTVLRGGNYGAVDLVSTFHGPGPLEHGAVDLASGQGPVNFRSSSDTPGEGFILRGAFLHDLTDLHAVTFASDVQVELGVELSQTLHVVNSRGQLILADTARPEIEVAGIGAVSGDGSLLIYPVSQGLRSEDELLTSGMGVRFAGRWELPRSFEDLPRLDPEGGGPTSYNLVQLTQGLSGNGSGANTITLATAAGPVSFDSTPAGAISGSTQSAGSFAAPSLVSSAIALDLDGHAVAPASHPDLVADGLYSVLQSGGQVQIGRSDGAMLGTGSLTQDGGIVAFQTFSGAYDEADPAEVRMLHGSRTFSVAVRRPPPASPPVQVSGDYNVVQYTAYVSDQGGAAGATGIVASGIRYGTVSLNAGNVGGATFSKWASFDLAAATGLPIEEPPPGGGDDDPPPGGGDDDPPPGGGDDDAPPGGGDDDPPPGGGDDDPPPGGGDDDPPPGGGDDDPPPGGDDDPPPGGGDDDPPPGGGDDDPPPGGGDDDPPPGGGDDDPPPGGGDDDPPPGGGDDDPPPGGEDDDPEGGAGIQSLGELVSLQAGQTALMSLTRPEGVSGNFDVDAVAGTVTMTLTIVTAEGSETVTGTGAVSANGEFIALAVESEDAVSQGRGLLFLVRQPQ